MKKTIYIIALAVLASLTMVSCDKYSYKDPVQTLVVESIDLNLDWQEGSGTITVKSDVNGPIKAKSSEENWCTVSESGMTVNVSVTSNPRFTSRTALITIENGVDSIEIPVTQGPSSFIVEAFDLSVGSKAGDAKVAASSTTSDISVKSNSDWITNERYRNGVITFDYDSNTEQDAKVGSISVTSGAITHDVIVTQNPDPYYIVIGEWEWAYRDDDDNLVLTTMSVKEKKAYETYTATAFKGAKGKDIDGTAIEIDEDYEFEINYSEIAELTGPTGRLCVVGQKLGSYNGQDLYLYPVGLIKGGYPSLNDPTYGYYAIWMNAYDYKKPIFGFVEMEGMIPSGDKIAGMALTTYVEDRVDGDGKPKDNFGISYFNSWTITKKVKEEDKD